MKHARRNNAVLWLAILALTLSLSALVVRKAHAQLATDAGPASAHSAVTPSNSTTLTDNNGTPYCRALFISGAGDISITDVNNVTVVYTVPAGTLLPFRPKRVNLTSTTATGIVCWRS